MQIALLPLFDYDLDKETLEKLKKKRTVTDKGIPVLAKGISFQGVHELFSLSPHRIGKAHFLAGMGNEYHRYFKFAFVRNPWDRLVSCYMSKLVIAGPGFNMRPYGDVTLRRDMTFKEFAEAVCRIRDEESDPHFRSQHIVICDDGPGKGILADFVGRFENLEEDFGIVAKRLGGLWLLLLAFGGVSASLVHSPALLVLLIILYPWYIAVDPLAQSSTS